MVDPSVAVAPIRRSRGQRRLLAVLFGLLAAVLVLELLLQSIALMLWFGTPARAATRSDHPAILCVGDSFTYGMGASDPAHSYPEQLERLLRERGVPAQVANLGWPGQRTREVLKRLPEQLERLSPRLVYVLVGTNDLGSVVPAVRREELSKSEDRRFEWRLRTLVLARLIRDWLTGNDLAARHGIEQTALLGDWHDGDTLVRFSANGQMTGWGHTLYWRVDRGDLCLDTLNRDGEVRAPCALGPDGLLLTVPTSGERVRLRRGRPANLSALVAAQLSLEDGDLARAVAGFESVLQVPDPEQEPQARAGLVRALVRSGRPDAAQQHLRALEARHAAQDPRVGKHLAAALCDLGEASRAVDVAIDLSKRDIPVDFADLMIAASSKPEQHHVVQAKVERSLEDADLRPWTRALLLRFRALAIRHTSPDAALLALAEAELLLTMPELLARMLDEPVFPAGAWERCLQSPQFDAQQRGLLRTASQRSAAAVGSVDNLAANLALIVDLCRERSAEPVFLTYPSRIPRYDSVLRRVALEQRVPLLEVSAHFEQLLKSRTYTDLFAVDAHCNDGGYLQMAELVAADAQFRMR